MKLLIFTIIAVFQFSLSSFAQETVQSKTPQTRWQPGFYNFLSDDMRMVLNATTEPLTNKNGYNFLLLSEMNGFKGCSLKAKLNPQNLEIQFFDEHTSRLYLFKIPLEKALFSGRALEGEKSEAYMLVFDQPDKTDTSIESESFVITFFLKKDGSEATKINITSVKNTVYQSGIKRVWGVITGKATQLPGENIDCSAE